MSFRLKLPHGQRFIDCIHNSMIILNGSDRSKSLCHSYRDEAHVHLWTQLVNEILEEKINQSMRARKKERGKIPHYVLQLRQIESLSVKAKKRHPWTWWKSHVYGNVYTIVFFYSSISRDSLAVLCDHSRLYFDFTNTFHDSNGGAVSRLWLNQ